MKLLYFAVIVIMMTRCTSNKTDDRTKPDSTQVKSMTFTLSDSAKRDMFSDPISLQSAAELGSYVLSKDSSLRSIAQHISFGGVFDASIFTPASQMAGVRLWYCFNPSDSTLPTFFLAAEQIKKYYDKNPDTLAGSKLFYVPEIFQYDTTGIDVATVKSFIQTKKKSSTRNKTIGRKEVRAFSKNFKMLMKIISPNKKAHCKYPVAYFVFNNHYQDFMSLKPKHIRYYIGFADDTIHKPNFLRPILAAVDSSGTTITKTANMLAAPLLQKSVPPPPK